MCATRHGTMLYKNNRFAYVYYLQFYIFNYVIILFKVTLEIQLIFPDNVVENTQQHGICYVKAFPLFTTDEISVSTDDGCTITNHPVTINSTYTSAVFFTLDKINGYCQHISCLTQIREEMKYFTISKC